jgi:hypothetical protein
MIIVDDKYEEEEAQTNTQNQHQHQHQSNSTTSNVKNTFTKTKKDSRSFEEKNTKNGQEATRLLEELSQCDGIMEPNVLQIINGFLRTYKGNNGPELLVEKLSTSYRGRAQMIELVASWLDEMPISKNAMEKKIISFDGHAQMILPGTYNIGLIPLLFLYSTIVTSHHTIYLPIYLSTYILYSWYKYDK